MHGDFDVENNDTNKEHIRKSSQDPLPSTQNDLVIDEDEIGREKDLISELEKIVIDTEVDKDTLRLLEEHRQLKRLQMEIIMQAISISTQRLQSLEESWRRYLTKLHYLHFYWMSDQWPGITNMLLA